MSALRKRKYILIIAVFLLCLTVLLIYTYSYLFHKNDGNNVAKIKPVESALNDISANLNSVLKWSSYYNVSSQAIMGIILAERSLHTGPVNYFEEYYVKNTYLSKSDEYLNKLAQMTKANLDQVRMIGESENEFRFRLKHGLIWTIGLCQISIIKSIEIDSLISAEEQCATRSVRQNIEGLLSPDTNIRYCAFELKSIREKYKKITGMDIGNNIGVLTTLYNTGKVLESGAKYNNTQKLPRSNFFGRFVELQLPLLNSLAAQNK